MPKSFDDLRDMARGILDSVDHFLVKCPEEMSRFSECLLQKTQKFHSAVCEYMSHESSHYILEEDDRGTCLIRNSDGHVLYKELTQSDPLVGVTEELNRLASELDYRRSVAPSREE